MFVWEIPVVCHRHDCVAGESIVVAAGTPAEAGSKLRELLDQTKDVCRLDRNEEGAAQLEHHLAWLFLVAAIVEADSVDSRNGRLAHLDYLFDDQHHSIVKHTAPCQFSTGGTYV